MNDNHIRFADKYFEKGDAAESAVYAGFSSLNAKQSGYQLLKREDIQAYLSDMREEYQLKYGVNKERIIAEYAKIAFFDIRNIYDVDGGLVHVKQLDDNSAGAICSIKSTEEWGEDDDGNRIITGINKEVKIFDKIRALQDLGKHLGIFEKDNEQLNPNTKKLIIKINRNEDNQIKPGDPISLD